MQDPREEQQQQQQQQQQEEEEEMDGGGDAEAEGDIVESDVSAWEKNEFKFLVHLILWAQNFDCGKYFNFYAIPKNG